MIKIIISLFIGGALGVVTMAVMISCKKSKNIVLCKDCKWFNEIGCAIGIVDDSDKPKEDDFCSFGERKDGAE